MSLHPNCMLKRCAHYARGSCRVLGECGAWHVLQRASEAGGHEVIARENPTVEALHNAGLITKQRAGDDGRVITIKAVAVSRGTKRRVA